MFDSLPQDTATLMQWSWPQFEPYYRDLEARPLTTDSVGEFLADWTRVNDAVEEIGSRLYVATTVNTADEEGEERYHTYLEEIYPPMQEAEQRLKEKLLASGMEPARFEVPLRKMRAEAEIFCDANLPLLTEERKLSLRYNKIIGAQTVQWEGREVTISQLRPVYKDPDRSRREHVWRLGIERQMADRETINALWQELLSVRLSLADNAGFDDYRSYRWKQLHRFDYTPDDCATFWRAIEEVVVPAALRIYERRRQRLGVETLRPWDLDVDPFDRPPLRPFSDVAELRSKAAAIFHRVDPQLGAYFDTMAEEGLLDLENRMHKAPGAYCTTFPAAKRPFVFANAVGLQADIQSLLHESGHAFHVFERSRLPYYQQRHPGAEMAEVASMAMELLTAPYLLEEEGGFYSEADVARARVEHLEGDLLFWPYMAVVDAFQHWVYENPDAAMDPDNCDAQWGTLWERFMQGVDWSGLEQEMMTGWHRKRHIHRYPFYYVEYGLAQMGAVQVWASALKDQAKAVANYRRALALGSTVPLPQLYAAAGAKFAFDADTLRTVVNLMVETIDTLAS